MTFHGLFDRIPCPDRLRGHVVTPTSEPRIHGYAVQSDLSLNTSQLDTSWLALTGELPTRSEREVLDTALIWLSPLHVGESPVHAAVLARIAGAPDEVIPSIAALAIGQYIADEITALRGLARWLEGCGEPPEAAIEPEPSPELEALHERLVADSKRWFGEGIGLPARPVLRRTAAAYALLHKLGVGDTPRLIAWSTLARLPVVLAEALYVRPGAIQSYPARTPDYRYTEDER